MPLKHLKEPQSWRQEIPGLTSNMMHSFGVLNAEASSDDLSLKVLLHSMYGARMATFLSRKYYKNSPKNDRVSLSSNPGVKKNFALAKKKINDTFSPDVISENERYEKLGELLVLALDNMSNKVTKNAS